MILTEGDFWDGLADLVDPDNQSGLEAPLDWEGWLKEMFPNHVRKAFAPHQEEYWQWVWSINRGQRPPPFIGIWPRGGGKSASGEMGVAALGSRDARKYVVYVSSTQPQADKRVGNIGSLLESEAIATYYPAMGRRAVGKFGAPKGWRRNRLQTASGLVVDALGLETAARGLKEEDQRPDLIVLDDIDDRHDSPSKTKKKIEIITETILPMGSSDVAVLGLQNVILCNGIFHKLASGKATFLIDRHVSGPTPALVGLKTKTEEFQVAGEEFPRVRSVIERGIPTWEGQGIAECQNLIDNSGLSAFLREQQHEVDEVEGALWTRALIRNVGTYPTLKRVVVGVDPSGGRAEIGIVAAGLGHDGKAYVLKDNTQPGSLGPNNWGRIVIVTYEGLEADRIVAEKNFGGDMVENTIRAAAGGEKVPVDMINSSRGKALRAEPVVTFYERGEVLHVGVHQELETEMTRWVPGDPDSPNRLDALVFALTELLLPELHAASGASSLQDM